LNLKKCDRIEIEGFKLNFGRTWLKPIPEESP